MEKNNGKPNRFKKLRKQAEKRLFKSDVDLSKLPLEEVNELIHELQVHQIELEMQNEELRKSQLNLEAVRDRYIDLYDFAPVSYFSISEKGLILDANFMGAAMLGMERAKLSGSRFSQFIARDDQDVFTCTDKNFLKRKRSKFVS